MRGYGGEPGVGSWNHADWRLPRNVKNHLAQILLARNCTIDRGGRGILAECLISDQIGTSFRMRSLGVGAERP